MRNPKFLPCLCLVMAASLPAAMAQTAELIPAHSAPAAATSATVVPMLVRYNGVAVRSNGNALPTSASMNFLIFKEEKGGEPLWIETQNVAIDPAGRYETYLGSTYSAGLPRDLFGTGEARWLETQIAGEAPGARTLLTSVPYAFKAADAATLGGFPASAFVLTGSTPTNTTSIRADGITADSINNVTTTGGNNLYLPKFSAASTVVNSEIYDTGTSVGIGGVPNSSVRLDVNGAMIMRGNMQVTRTGNATTSQSYPSYGFQFYSNAYNSFLKTNDNPYFQLQSEPAGNNTSTPSATFNLLFSNSGSAPAETGFYVNPNGTLHFAPSQSFPGTGPGTITGITTAGPLTGSGTSGSVNLGLDIPALESSLNSVYPQLATNNVFAGSGSFSGGVFSSVIQAYATGVYGSSSGNGGNGVFGYATGGSGNNTYPTGVLGITHQGFGAQGLQEIPTVNYAGVLAQNGDGSHTYTRVKGYATVSGGVWGDSTDRSDVPFSIGVIGTADGAYAGYFQNDSANYPTVHAVNNNTGAVGNLFQTLMASTSNGTCGFGGAGNLTCTGQIKSLATAASTGRQVETYAMQSPENWMEDFGSGQLHDGTGFVTLDSVFADTVSESADYHVFLTPSGDSKGLYVSNKTARGFEVRESGGGTASVGFDYRIVAKRRGMETQRHTDVTERFKEEMKSPLRAATTSLKP